MVPPLATYAKIRHSGDGIQHEQPGRILPHHPVKLAPDGDHGAVTAVVF
jgi:hypothetical protein